MGARKRVSRTDTARLVARKRKALARRAAMQPLVLDTGGGAPALMFEPTAIDERVQLTVLVRPGEGSTLARDVVAGLRSVPKVLPPKHFYDDLGSLLFDLICETPEYYVTRTEQALLERIAGELVDEVKPEVLVELGSGAARKTRALLDAMGSGVYAPIDISEDIVVRSATELTRDYPWLRVRGVIADYEQGVRRLPAGGRRLVAFLGGSIGNFEAPDARAFVAGIGARLRPGDALLVGMDLVKSPAVLHAAYNDAAGITAEFNRNVLRVINRALRADFRVQAFEHVAFYRPELQRIEMHLRARAHQRVHVRALGMTVEFDAGETVRTEISRKFTRASGESLIAAAGLRVRRWWESPDGYFALALAERP